MTTLDHPRLRDPPMGQRIALGRGRPAKWRDEKVSRPAPMSGRERAYTRSVVTDALGSLVAGARPEPIDDHTIHKIIAAAWARIDPRETARALGWPVGKLLRVEQQIGLRITITVEKP